MPLAAALLVAPLAVSMLCSQTPRPASDNQVPLASPTAQNPATTIPAQPEQSPEGSRPDSRPIAIVPLDSAIPGYALDVTGALRVNNGRALIATDAAITAGSQPTHVTLPDRGTLLICPYTIVKLAATSSVAAGQVHGLMMAMDHGAFEMSLAISRDSDILLTPDFRILVAGPGPSELKVRLGPQGDTCIDNPGEHAPYVLVSSVFDGGAYRVQPGQRVMFQHGSLHEVVDQEKESCGCPPAEPQGNEFPVAQSEGLAPMPKPAPIAPNSSSAPPQVVEPLVYKSADHAPQPAPTEPALSANAIPPQPATQKKTGFFKSIGRFFKRIFGAE